MKKLLIIAVLLIGVSVSAQETVTSPTGKVWMNRNLGAETPSDYGFLYQWGRYTDGHQERDSKLTRRISETPFPNHDKFIRANNNSDYDWIIPHDDLLWEFINNPCPDGFRLPTKEEWKAEIDAETIGSLNLPLAGMRTAYGGSPMYEGVYGCYWSSGTIQRFATYIGVTKSYSGISHYMRGYGFSVRCIKD